MKEALRLAQSLSSQVIEDIDVFAAFSSPPTADSSSLKKRDSTADSKAGKGRFRGAVFVSNCRALETC
jgi:hypothetical protein